MSDDFTREKFAWLDRIAADSHLPATASRVAILFLRYMNRQTGEAWPSIARLASDMSTTQNTVRSSLKALKDRGHLLIETGGGNRSNTYRIGADPCKKLKGTPLQNSGGVKNNTPAKKLRSPPQFSSFDPSRKLKTNPMKEPIEEPIERETLSPVDQKSVDDGFESFWSIYPKRVAKPAGLKSWRAALKSGASPAEIIEGARRYSEERDREPDPEKRVKFTAHPATWLNGRRWLDAPAPVAAPAARAIASRRRNPDGRNSYRLAGVDLDTFEIESQ